MSPSYVTPKKAAAFVFHVGLESQAAAGTLQANPTLAAGDAIVSIDDGPFNNLATLPVVDPAAGKTVKVSLSVGEMNGDNIIVILSDAAGAEWYDLHINIQTTAQQIDDVVTSAGVQTVLETNKLDHLAAVADSDDVADGSIIAKLAASDADWSGFSAATDSLEAVRDQGDAAWDTAAGFAVAGDAMTLTGTYDAAKTAAQAGDAMTLTGTYDAAKTAASATALADVETHGNGAWATATSVTVSDKTGFSLSVAGIAAIWNALTSGMATAGSIGKRIVDYLTGDVFGRLGAPAGASIAADIAAAQTDIDAIQTSLSTSSVTVIAAIDGDDITVYRGTTWAIDITVPAAAETDWTWYAFGIKQRPSDADASAIVLISDDVGLEVLNGATGTAVNGSVTIDGTTLTVALAAASSATLTPQGSLYGEIKYTTVADGTVVYSTYTVEIVADIVRATS